MDKNWQFLLCSDFFSKFDAFVCHGTLLGLVRDGNLIPWDQDIDVAVFAEDFCKDDAVDMFSAAGFECLDYGKGYDYLTFRREGGRNIDINLYRRIEGGRATLWKVPRTKFIAMLLFMANIGRLARHPKKVIRLLAIFSPICAILDRLFGVSPWFFERKGYFIPDECLVFGRVIETRLLNAVEKVPAPLYSEKLLELTYGSNWRSPKQDYDWEREALSLHAE